MFGNAILQALCGWREFSNRGNTENNGRKEPLKICVSADGRDLLLLRTDAAEKTVECGSKARGPVPGGRAGLSIQVLCFLLYSNKPGLEESAAASGREQQGGKVLHDSTSLGLRSGFGVPW